MDGPAFTAASDHSLLLTLSTEIREDVHRQLRRLCALLEAEPHPAIRNLHPAYASLLVSFEPRVAGFEEIRQYVEGALARAGSAPEAPQRLVEIPVCYGGDFGPDLEDVARLTGRSQEDVVRLHAAPEYLVYFLGFSPGFPYLGGMREEIAVPRLDKPRTEVPAGSVGIGGRQTGVYPLASPGGWRIIGRTPLRLFQPERQPPALLAMGDRVRFHPVSPAEFEECRM